MPDRVTRMQIGHVFSGVNRAGAASDTPTGKFSFAAHIHRVRSLIRIAKDDLTRGAIVLIMRCTHT